MMETIKVNMTPCEDIKTIHASQNDNEGREWGFELHNNGEKIDSSSISDQLVFKAYEGGTEQILPENGSTPTTSPFNGDIKYPQGLLTDQEFLYRESPTEEDGNAKITDIKGNTLVWNQLCRIDSRTIAKSGVTCKYTYGNSITLNGTSSAEIDSIGLFRAVSPSWELMSSSHKYIFYVSKPNKLQLKIYASVTNAWGQTQGIVLAESMANKTSWYFQTPSNMPYLNIYAFTPSGETFDNLSFNFNLVDLTKMFGVGNEPASAEEFFALYPKSFYDSCDGAMLSFGGKNVKFNQLIGNGNFANTSIWGRNGITLSVSNNVGSFTTTANSQGIFQTIATVQGHKYFIKADIKFNSQGNVYFGFSATETGGYRPTYAIGTSWTTIADVITASENNLAYAIYDGRSSGFGLIQARNVMLVDLTEMFGQGCEPSAQGFLELFPNDYYEYTTGQYMNIGQPISLKTTGKNLLPYPYLFETVTRTGITMTVNTDGSIKAIGTNTSSVVQRYDLANITLEKGSYIFTGFAPQNGAYGTLRDGDSDSWIMNIGVNNPLTVSKKTNYRITLNIVGNASIDTTYYPLIRFADADSSYEPYTSSTLSLPISTYFPNGMKSAGSVYDELTESKAITRIGAVDLGSLTWYYRGSGAEVAPYYWASFTDIKSKGSPSLRKANMLCAKYPTVVRSIDDFVDKTICTDGTNTILLQIQIKDSSFTDATAFKNSLQGVYLYYEMVNETETSFTTASLVTENAEIPLSNDDGTLIGKCTEELSAQPGFFDAKIKLTDGDGDCYSNKIQLHVERKP